MSFDEPKKIFDGVTAEAHKTPTVDEILKHPFLVDVEVTLADNTPGNMRIQFDGTGRLEIIMPYTGKELKHPHGMSSLPKELSETRGSQVIVFSDSQARSFVEFLLSLKPFKIEEDWETWRKFLCEGISEKTDVRDSLITPRLQATWLEYESDQNGENTIYSSHEMYFPFNQENIQTIINGILSEH